MKAEEARERIHKLLVTGDNRLKQGVAPEKVRFRYKLEGQNRNWHEVINDRRIQYTNLAPGPYRFRVMASNNSGVWNETGDTLSFSIAPAYYQTWWFAALLVVATAALLWEA